MERFDEVELIGVGAYGKVYRARRLQKGDTVAVKRVRKVGGDVNDFHSTTIREIGILRDLNHDHIVKSAQLYFTTIKDCCRLLEIIPRSNSLLMVFEHLDCDLKSLIASEPSTLTPSFAKVKTYCSSNSMNSHVQRTMFQLLQAAAYFHSRRIMHRDLKSQNILINKSRSVAKIADFGLARCFSIPVRAYTHEVVTLWYRAPEILLGMSKYTAAIDIWSLGCIFTELINARPLFRGDSEVDQLMKIFEILGTPNEKTLPGVDRLRVQIKLCQQWRAQPLHRYLHCTDVLAMDLLSKMLCYDPNKRITAGEALLHPYFNSVRKQPGHRALQPTTLTNRCL